MLWQPICPYCNRPATLIDSIAVYGTSYGMIWDCRPCDAYVGVHRNSPDHAPLGSLANRETREWRKRAHRIFDPIWKSGKMKRWQAYKLMQERMGLDKDEAHIAMFTLEQCQELIRLFAVRGNMCPAGGESEEAR